MEMKKLMRHPHEVLKELGSAGKYVVESEIYNTGYLFNGNKLVILRGKQGVLEVEFDKLEALIEELQGLKELQYARRMNRIKGA